MSRTITITDAAAPALGETITGRTYRLLAADGTTVLSTANPPYVGVSDGLLYVEQTATQSDAQTGVATIAIPGRVTDLAASNATRPVLTWTDVGGETSYEVHRGAPGFTPDVSGGTTRIVTLTSGTASYTDGSIAGNGATSYGYRVVAKTNFGYTVGSEATTTPAAPVVQYTTDFSTNGNLTAYAQPWVAGPQYTANTFTASGGVAYLRGSGVDGALYDPVVPASAEQSITATLTMASLLSQLATIVFRASGTGTSAALLCYRASVAFNTDHYELRLERTDGSGGATRLATASLAALSLNTPYEFYGTVFDANGGVVLNAHVGSVSLAYTDTSASKITTIGRRGLYGSSGVNTSPTTGLLLLDYKAA